MTDLRPVDSAEVDRARAAHTVGELFDDLAERLEDGKPLTIEGPDSYTIPNVAGALVVLFDDDGRPYVLGRMTHQFTGDEGIAALNDASRVLEMMSYGYARGLIDRELNHRFRQRAEAAAERERFLAERPYPCLGNNCCRRFKRPQDLATHLASVSKLHRDVHEQSLARTQETPS